MKLFKVKNDKDFIFKLVILITIFSLIFFFIYLFYNLDSILPVYEGLENKDSNEGKTETTESTESKDDLNEDKIKIIKTVNNALSYENDIRSQTLEKIDFYKNYNKAALIYEILLGTRDNGNLSETLKNRIDVYTFLNSGELENIISNFPLAESVQSTKQNETVEQKPNSDEPITTSSLY